MPSSNWLHVPTRHTEPTPKLYSLSVTHLSAKLLFLETQTKLIKKKNTLEIHHKQRNQTIAQRQYLRLVGVEAGVDGADASVAAVEVVAAGVAAAVVEEEEAAIVTFSM